MVVVIIGVTKRPKITCKIPNALGFCKFLLKIQAILNHINTIQL
tara:strand:- start:77320 stop:77451 length:132 start_codon:yes stop_codon:yes gene_type:complete